jgi:LysM repeat protein
MADRWRPRRRPSRYLAPLALAATCAGIYLIVSHGVRSNSTPQGGSPNTTQHNSPGGRTGTSTTSSTRTTTTGTGVSYYVVRSGDTLSAIAVQTHVPVATIERLNPGIAANALRVGQRLRLRR